MTEPEAKTLDDVLSRVPENYRKIIEPIGRQLIDMQHKRETILATARKQRKIIQKLHTRLAECSSKDDDALDAHAVLPDEHKVYKAMATAYSTLLKEHKALEAQYQTLLQRSGTGLRTQ